MANKIKGLTISINGETTGLDKALSGVNKKSRDLQGELREVERLLKLDPGNTELLAQKQKLLAESVENTKTKLDTLKTSAEQAQEQLERGEISEEQFRALQREVAKTEQALEELEKQSKDFGSTFSQQLENAGKKMQEFGGKVSDIGKKMLPATAAITGAGAVAMKYAADVEDAMGATEQIFGSASDSMKTWATDLESYYGIAKGEALEYGNTMGAMLQNIGGLTEEEAAKQAQTLIKLAGDLTAMYGGTTEDAVRALTGALKGNNTMLDNYGMAANDAMVKSKALEMGLISQGQEMDLASKQAATLALIMEQSGAAQGQAARESDGASGSMRAMQTDMKNLASSFGEVLLPAISPIVQKISEFVQWLGSLDEGTRTTIAAIAAIVAVLGPIIIVVGTVIDKLGVILEVLPKLKGAIVAMNAAMAANPILAVVAVIAILVAAIVTLWNTNEGFRNAVIAVWAAIQEGIGSAIDAVKGFFSGLAANAIEMWESIKASATAGVNTLKTFFTVTIPGHINTMVSFFAGLPGRIWEALLAAIAKIQQWGNDIKAWAEEKLPAPIATIVGFFATLPGKLLEIGANMVSGLWNGIWSKVEWVKGKIAGFVDMIKGWFTNKDGFDTHSPSKWAEAIGGFVTTGLANGILAARDKAVDAAQSVVDATQKVFEGISYDSGIDYAAQIDAAKLAGDFDKAAELERTRNAKIDGDGLSWTKTFDFQGLADTLGSLASNASYATSPVASPGYDMGEIAEYVAQAVSQALTAGLAEVGNSIFDAIPKRADFNVNGRKMAQATWDDFTTEGSRRGLIFAPSRAQIASIAMSVMPKTL